MSNFIKSTHFLTDSLASNFTGMLNTKTLNNAVKTGLNVTEVKLGKFIRYVVKITEQICLEWQK